MADTGKERLKPRETARPLIVLRIEYSGGVIPGIW